MEEEVASAENSLLTKSRRCQNVWNFTKGGVRKNYQILTIPIMDEMDVIKLDNVQLVCYMTYEEYNYTSNGHETQLLREINQLRIILHKFFSWILKVEA